ncbi:MAG TPA: NUDIX hydrolase [Pseudonocardiaceae bacterium]|nr:NUDIX hydrolase [Pseudonocardiaceae bacterium]
MPELVAAGAVLWRRPDPGRPDTVEVAVVHRPHYQDWSWPKGKPVKGEALPATAVREVAEETGHTAVLGPRLGNTHYPVAAGMKIAHYWAAHSTGGRFEPSDEVDELRWLPPAEAAELLSYPHDRTLLDRLDLATSGTGTVLLVRHAKAGKREEWDGADELRPLTAAGQRQAEALRAVLPLFGVQRVYSPSLLRCRQTVEGLAADLGVPVIEEPLLSESGYPADPSAAQRRMAEIAAGPGPAVVCSQGGVVPDLVARLFKAAELDLPDQPPSRKGSFWALFFGGESPSLTLRTADYYDDPLRGC